MRVAKLRPLPMSKKEPRDESSGTLGAVLYANGEGAAPLEIEWLELVQAIALGDQLALHALYARAHRLVFTLALRITHNRQTADELTMDVFHDIWRDASRYEPAVGSVVGWILNRTRSR